MVYRVRGLEQDADAQLADIVSTYLLSLCNSSVTITSAIDDYCPALFLRKRRDKMRSPGVQALPELPWLSCRHGWLPGLLLTLVTPLLRPDFECSVGPLHRHAHRELGHALF